MSDLEQIGEKIIFIWLGIDKFNEFKQPYFNQNVLEIYKDICREIYKDIYRDMQSNKVEELSSILKDIFFKPKFNTKTRKNDIYTYFEEQIRRLNELLRCGVDYKHMLNISNDIIVGNDKAIEYVNDSIVKSVCFKLCNIYNKFLPKRRLKEFKSKYPLLNNSIEIYEEENNSIKLFNRKISDLNKENSNICTNEDDKYIQVKTNEGISDIICNSSNFNKSIISDVGYNKYEVLFETPKGNILQMIPVETNDVFSIVRQVEGLLSPAQLQLIVYIMSLSFEQNKCENAGNYYRADIDLKEYCKLKGIEFRERVADEIYKDIDELKKILIQYTYTNKNGEKITLDKTPIIVNLGIHSFHKADKDGIKNKIIKVSLGSWIETLRDEQFQYINEAFFKYKLRNNTNLIALSYYINTQHRNNLKNFKDNSNEFKTRVSNLTNTLAISEETICKKGYKKALKESLEKALDVISSREGFDWKYKYGEHTSRIDFEQDIIIFSNKELDRIYHKKGYKKKTNK